MSTTNTSNRTQGKTAKAKAAKSTKPATKNTSTPDKTATTDAQSSRPASTAPGMNKAAIIGYGIAVLLIISVTSGVFFLRNAPGLIGDEGDQVAASAQTPSVAISRGAKAQSRNQMAAPIMMRHPFELIEAERDYFRRSAAAHQAALAAWQLRLEEAAESQRQFIEAQAERQMKAFEDHMDRVERSYASLNNRSVSIVTDNIARRKAFLDEIYQRRANLLREMRERRAVLRDLQTKLFDQYFNGDQAA